MANVLYVEDDFLTLKSAIRVLGIGGHTAKGARDGQKGLEVLAEDDIQIICTDFNMPVMNGYDFSRAVKTNPKYANIPIIGVGDFPPDKREYLVWCFKKPFDPRKLLECIDQHCR